MGILTKGDNVIFVNDPSRYPLLITNQAADFSSNPNAATQDGLTGNVLHIGAYASRVRLGGLAEEIRALRPQPATKQVITIDPTDTNQIDLATNFTVGQSVFFCIATDLLYGSQVEFYRASPGERSQYGRTNFFSVRLRAGDTETTVLTRLAQAINDIPTQDYGEYPYKADFGVTNAGKFTLQAKNSDYLLSMFAYDVKGIDSPSVNVPVLKPQVAVQAFEGQGNYETLQATYRLQTESRNEPYSLQQWDAPVAGSLYTCVQFKTLTARPDLVSTELADSPVNGSLNTFTVYVANGVGGEAFLTTLLNFLNRAPASVSKVFVKRDGTVLAVPGAAGTPGSFLADA